MAEHRPSPIQSDQVYFSYWSWHLLKDCPLSYKLIVLGGLRKSNRDTGNAIQGSIPDKMSEVFFALPPTQRDVSFFLDPQKFEQHWSEFLQAERVDWMFQARRYAKKRPALKADIPEQLKPEQEKFWSEWALKLKKAETWQHVTNMVKLITTMGLQHKQTSSQVEFKVQVEPSQTKDGVLIPSLSIGGRIDLVVQEENNVEDIWDVKAVEQPKKLDLDQLIIYRMARRAQGKTVRTVGYLHARQCEIDPKKITDGHEYELRKLMRTSLRYFISNNFPANWRPWWCPNYCDARDICEVHQRHVAGSALLSKIKAGEVSFE